MDQQANIDERMNCTFILASSLYFRLEVVDRQAQDARLFGWSRLLYDTSRDLSVLADNWSEAEPVDKQLTRGVADLVDSLRDLAHVAHHMNKPKLGVELLGYIERLTTRIDLQGHWNR